MTEYKVMAKGKHGKKFQCYGHESEPKFAENYANHLVRSLWTEAVKVIVIDDNGVKNELIYKA